MATPATIAHARKLGAGPGKIPPGTRVTCLPGALPSAEDRWRQGAVVSVGPKATKVVLFGDGGRERRVDNTLLTLDSRSGYPEAYGIDPLDRPPPFGEYTYGRGGPGRWRPRFAWMSWTIAEHLEHAAGRLPLPTASTFAPPRRLVIVGCGHKKAARKHSDAHSMYVGSYHLAARRAADALVGRSPGRFDIGDGVDTYQMILSARYGLLDLFAVVETYDLRMGKPGSVTAETVAYQAQQFGLDDATEVIVLAGKAYADVVTAVWPHAIRPLDGTASIGEQLAILAGIARTGQLPAPKEATVASKVRTPHRMAMRYPAALRAGDVFVHPERGQLTFVSSTVASSARPTVARITVKEGEPFETDAFHGPRFEIVSRGSVDPLFAEAHKGTAHLFVPLTNERTRCGECGDTNTPNHVPTIGGPGSDVDAEDVKAAAAAGTVIRCPSCAKRATVRIDGAVGKHGRHNCSLVGQPPPADAVVLSRPVDEPQPDLFTGLAGFSAMVAKSLGLTSSAPRVIPLVDAQWGMYGEVKGYGPTGDRRTVRGYVTKPPRVTTRGFSGDGPNRREGDRLLDFAVDEPPLAGQSGGSSTHMFAEEGATFAVLEAPADRPLTARRSLARRMPVEDLRKGDVFHVWNDPGLDRGGKGDLRPRYHVQADPRRGEGGRYEVDVLVEGEPTTRSYASTMWADIDDPEQVSWRATNRHWQGTVRMPWTTPGGLVKGQVVPALVCCHCGGVEITRYAWEINHDCCAGDEPNRWPKCRAGRTSSPLRPYWTPDRQDRPATFDLSSLGPAVEAALAGQ